MAKRQHLHATSPLHTLGHAQVLKDINGASATARAERERTIKDLEARLRTQETSQQEQLAEASRKVGAEVPSR